MRGGFCGWQGGQDEENVFEKKSIYLPGFGYNILYYIYTMDNISAKTIWLKFSWWQAVYYAIQDRYDAVMHPKDIWCSDAP